LEMSSLPTLVLKFNKIFMTFMEFTEHTFQFILEAVIHLFYPLLGHEPSEY
jgi:hypothetical protein